MTEHILEKLLQMFEMPFSGMFHVVHSILSKSVWKCLPVKTSCKNQLTGSIMLVISTERCLRLEFLMIH